MKILQVIPYFSPQRGGDVNVVYNLSRQLAKRKHDVTLITTDFEFNKAYAHTLEREGVKVISFHCITNIKLLLISPKMKKWLKQKIKNFDIIHLHEFRSYQNNIVYHYAKKYDVPYILEAHGSLLHMKQKQISKKLYDLIYGNKILKNSFKVIALTNTESEHYKKMGVNENQIEVVPNGIDLSRYDNLPGKGEFKRKYGVKDNEKLILYLGRLHQSKGIDLLIKVFANILKESNDAKLILVGPDDGYINTLKNLSQKLRIDDKVIFTGFINNEEKMASFIDADVFVTPSFSGFPITFLEACLCRTSIITTNKGDKLDWINNKVGYVVKYDEAELQEAILKVLSNEELRKRFGKEGIKLVEEEFNWNKVSRKIEKLYQDH